MLIVNTPDWLCRVALDGATLSFVSDSPNAEEENSNRHNQTNVSNTTTTTIKRRYAAREPERAPPTKCEVERKRQIKKSAKGNHADHAVTE